MDPKVIELINLGRANRRQGETTTANIIFDGLRALGIEPDAVL
jgi:hypothetical protein